MKETILRIPWTARTALASLLLASALLSPLQGGEGGQADLSPELEAILVKVDRANSDLQTLTADLSYRRTIPLLDESETSSGRLSFKIPDKIHMTLGEPRNEEMVSDGRTWWLVDHDAAQVEIYETDGEQKVAEASFLDLGYGRSADELKEDYHITLVSAEDVKVTSNGDEETKTRWHMRLVPKNGERPARFERMEVKITEDLYLPETITLHESDGEIVHTFELENIRLNEEIDGSRFEGDIPRGYRTVRP